MKFATKVQPAAGQGNGSVRTQNQPVVVAAALVGPELLVLNELLLLEGQRSPAGLRQLRHASLRICFAIRIASTRSLPRR